MKQHDGSVHVSQMRSECNRRLMFVVAARFLMLTQLYFRAQRPLSCLELFRVDVRKLCCLLYILYGVSSLVCIASDKAG